jgi:hypothetical protein
MLDTFHGKAYFRDMKADALEGLNGFTVHHKWTGNCVKT